MVYFTGDIHARVDGYDWDDTYVSDSDIRLIVICD